MNKYSSKAIKTAATVGMSLAMVLSAVPATPVFAATENVCTVAQENAVSDVLSQINDINKVNSNTKVTVNSDSVKLFDYVTGDGKAAFDAVTDDACSSSVRTSAKKLVTIITNVTKLVSDLSAWENFTLDDGLASVEGIKNDPKTAIDIMEALENAIDKNYYDNNLTDDQKTYFDDVKNTVEGNWREATGATQDKDLAAFLKNAEFGLNGKGPEATLKAISEQDKISEADVKNAMKALKAENGTSTQKATYKRFASEPEVEDILATYDEMLDEIKEIKNLTNQNKTEEYSEYIKGGNDSVSKLVTGATGDSALKKVKNLESKITISDFETLKAFKETVIDNLYTMATRKLAGKYVDNSTETQFLANVDKFVTEDSSLFPAYLTTVVDKETGEFGWDHLVAYMEEVENNLKALTDGIKELDAVTLVQADRDALVAADEAVYFFDGNYGNLTSSQEKAVKQAERKVDELLEAYRVKFGSINVEVNGWVNKGNGDWAYYENGNAVTKWVASGSDWYYVKGGVMLRNSWIASDSQGTKWYYVDDAGKMVSNTTVNGYTFNSYGVWVK